MAAKKTPSLTFLCISNDYKGHDFLIACKKAGANVYFVTSKKHEHKEWPREHLDDIFFVQQDENEDWDMDEVKLGMSHFMRTKKIDRIVALDDFDVEKASFLREHFRIPGMGQTTSRFFRDKLAMRIQANDSNINVPPFSSLFNDDDVHQYTQATSAPWVVKPRSDASASGIKKVNSVEELWEVLNMLGDKRHDYLIEQFKPGDVFHVDSLTLDAKVIFSRVSQYLNTPMEVAHGGGVFRTQTLQLGSKDEKALQRLNAKVMKAFGMQYSASHTEFIKSKEDGKFYFLETASRVGGANIAEMIEFSTGINLWREWAKIEVAVASGKTYKLPKVKNDYAGIIVSLSKHEQPDSSSFTDKEICWRLKKDYHIGLIVKSKKQERILELLNQYADRIYQDFHASMPSK